MVSFLKVFGRLIWPRRTDASTVVTADFMPSIVVIPQSDNGGPADARSNELVVLKHPAEVLGNGDAHAQYFLDHNRDVYVLVSEADSGGMILQVSDAAAAAFEREINGELKHIGHCPSRSSLQAINPQIEEPSTCEPQIEEPFTCEPQIDEPSMWVFCKTFVPGAKTLVHDFWKTFVLPGAKSFVQGFCKTFPPKTIEMIVNLVLFVKALSMVLHLFVVPVIDDSGHPNIYIPVMEDYYFSTTTIHPSPVSQYIDYSFRTLGLVCLSFIVLCLAGMLIGCLFCLFAVRQCFRELSAMFAKALDFLEYTRDILEQY